jgi:hypothetical protein
VHACGLATDCAQLQCIARGAPYLLVPCCVGKLNNDVKINSPYSLPRPIRDSAWRRGSDSSSPSRASSFTIHQRRPPEASSSARARRQNPGLPEGEHAPTSGESGAMPRSGWLRSQISEPAEWSALVRHPHPHALFVPYAHHTPRAHRERDYWGESSVGLMLSEAPMLWVQVSIANHNAYDFQVTTGDVAVHTPAAQPPCLPACLPACLKSSS